MIRLYTTQFAQDGPHDNKRSVLVIAYCFASLDQEAIIVQLVLLIHVTPYPFLCRNTERILCMNKNVHTYTIKQTIMIQRHV